MAVVTNTTGSGKSDSSPEALGDSRWWDKPVDEKATQQVHAQLVPYVGTLMSAWAGAEWDDRVHDAMYENRSLRSMKNASKRLTQSGFDPSRLMVTTSIVDTFTSRFTRRRPMPMFVVDDAEWELKQKAVEFGGFIRGQMAQTGVERLRPQIVKDASVRGTGVLYIDEGEDKPIVERVHRWELFVDPHEAAAGPEAVRQKHRVRRVAREVLIAEYPECEAQIRAANPSTRRQHETQAANDSGPSASWTTNVDVIDLYESWHLPSGCDAEDGRKAVCIENATLAFECWERPRFPFPMLRRHRRQDGYWGQGDVERLAPDQAAINKMAAAIERNIDVNSDLVIITNEMQDATPTEKLTGRGPRRIRVRGSVDGIKYHVPTPVSPGHMALLEKRISWMHDFSGVSEWSAQGRSPLGNGASGVAIDTMEDLQSDRHADFELEYSHFSCDIAQALLDAGRAIVARQKEAAKVGGKGYKKRRYVTTWMDRGTPRQLDWDSVAMEEEQYTLEIEPTSYLPHTRAGKLAAVSELSKAGIMDPDDAADQFEEPDIAHYNRINRAPRHNAHRVMGILGRPAEEAPMPEPLWDLKYHLKLARDYYNRSQCDKAPEEVQARYRDYIDAVQDELDKSASGMTPEAAAGPGGPMPPPPGAPPMDPMAAMPGAPPPMPMPEGMPMPPMPAPGMPQ